MSYKNIKHEIENLSQDHVSEDFYYIDKGECYKLKDENSEKIFESVNHKTNPPRGINKPEKSIENAPEQNLLSSQEINHGIKFSSVFSGKNIIIHGGGKLTYTALY